MKQIFTILGMALIHCVATAQYSCVTATPITAGIYDANFATGSEVPQPICTNGTNNNPYMGIWFKYTPEQLHTTTVSTSVTGFESTDTRMHIYTGTCGNLTCVTGDDDSGPNYSSITSFTAEPGVTYYIAFDNNWSFTSFHVSLTEAVYQPPMFTQQTVNISGMVLCVADLNGDYLDDIVSPDIVTSTVQVLYQTANDSGFTQATLPAASTNNNPSWSMAAGDYDRNGFNDLLYGGGNGATLLLADSNGTGFTTAISTQQYVFSQRTNFVDINNDGNLDAFICHDTQPNVYFLNDGNGGSTFHQGGLGDVSAGGNYGSLWVDYDNDGDMDLFIAKCRGGEESLASIDELHRNNGDGTYTNVAEEAGFVDYQQSWSSAWADFDNDGDMDVMIGASSDVYGSHKLMRNNGNGTFTNVTEGSGYDDQALLNIEHVAYDFDNDGWVDIFGGGNTIMFNKSAMGFAPRAVTATNGPVGDLNNDGFLDISNGNRVFFNIDNGNHWLKVHLEGVESNRNGIGARVEIYGAGDGWDKQVRDVRSGDGFKFMSSLNTHFGLGQTESLDQLVIKWPSGTIDIIENPGVDTAILVVEGSTALGLKNTTKNAFTVYPNPAKDVLNITSAENFEAVNATVYALDGKQVSNEKVSGSGIKVSHLAKGTYIVLLKDKSGRQYSSKFIKG